VISHTHTHTHTLIDSDSHAHILEHLHAIIAHETTALSRCCSYGCRTGVTEVQAPGRLQSPVRKYRPTRCTHMVDKIYVYTRAAQLTLPIQYYSVGISSISES